MKNCSQMAIDTIAHKWQMSKICICAFFVVVVNVAVAVPQADIDAAIARGVKYLLAQQAADGSFSDPQMPALTALCAGARRRARP